MPKRKARVRQNPKTDAKVVHTVPCGVPDLVQKVDIYDTTIDKLKNYHSREYERFPEVVTAIQEPTRIYQSGTNETDIILINDSSVSENSASPLCVSVKVYDDGNGIMSTAYFDERSKDKQPKKHGKMLWSKQDEK